MEIDPTVTTVIVSSITTLIITFGGRWLSRRLEKSQSEMNEGDAAKALSEAAKTQINTYNEEVVSPLRDRINGLEDENGRLRTLLSEINAQAESARRAYGEQIESLQLKIKEMGRSLVSQREQIAILIEQSANKDLTIKRMQAEIEQLQRENEDLKSRIERLQSENDVLKTHPAG